MKNRKEKEERENKYKLEIREIKWQKLIKKLNKRNESMSVVNSNTATVPGRHCHSSLILIRTIANNCARYDRFIKRASFGGSVTNLH
jgi:hypothetical protein